MKDLRVTALIFAVIGFFVAFGAVGAGDCNAPLSQVVTLSAIGATTMAVSVGYIYVYEKLHCK